MKNDQWGWTDEPQDLREMGDIALATHPLGTLRMLYACSAYLFLFALCSLVARDLGGGRTHEDMGEFRVALITVLQVLQAIFLLVTGVNWLVSYWQVNLLTKWFMLLGTASVWIYLHGAPNGGIPAVGVVMARLSMCLVGALGCELISMVWLLRRRDAERLYRLRRLGQTLGIASAGVMVLWLAVLEVIGGRP